MAACGGGGDENGDGVDPAPALKVGLIVDQGQLDDNGFNELAFKGSSARRRSSRSRAA